MILKPAEIKFSAGMYFIAQVRSMDKPTTMATLWECFAGGIKRDTNIAKRAIPMAPFKDSGIIPVENAPSIVPADQPIYGRVISPYIYEDVTGFVSMDAIANVSSVMTKLNIKRFKREDSLLVFWDKARDISIYLRFIISVVTVISIYEAFARISVVPANCPELVTLLMEIRILTHAGSPPVTAINPKVNATGRYPRHIGKPLINPSLYVRLWFDDFMLQCTFLLNFTTNCSEPGSKQLQYIIWGWGNQYGCIDKISLNKLY